MSSMDTKIHHGEQKPVPDCGFLENEAERVENNSQLTSGLFKKLTGKDL